MQRCENSMNNVIDLRSMPSDFLEYLKTHRSSQRVQLIICALGKTWGHLHARNVELNGAVTGKRVSSITTLALERS